MKNNYKKIDNLIVFDNGTLWREMKKYCRRTGLSVHQGYYRVAFRGKNYLVHKLIAELFIGKSDLTVDHIDGNKLNNAVSNLEYVTASENVKRAYKNGLHKKRNKEMADKQKKKVLWNGKVYNSAQELSLSLGLKKGACAIAIFQKTRIKGYYPKYIESE